MRYTAVEEAEITAQRTAAVPDDIDRSRVRFQRVSLTPCGRSDAKHCRQGRVCSAVPAAGAAAPAATGQRGRPPALGPSRAAINLLRAGTTPRAGRRVQPARQPGARGRRWGRCTALCCCLRCRCLHSLCLPKLPPAHSCPSPPPVSRIAVVAANLLCRLPDPSLFLRRLPSLIKPGGVSSAGEGAAAAAGSGGAAAGAAAPLACCRASPLSPLLPPSLPAQVLVLVSPYSWLPAWTPQDKWLGGYLGQVRCWLAGVCGRRAAQGQVLWLAELLLARPQLPCRLFSGTLMRAAAVGRLLERERCA